jgi:hypothetical protein
LIFVAYTAVLINSSAFYRLPISQPIKPAQHNRSDSPLVSDRGRASNHTLINPGPGVSNPLSLISFRPHARPNSGSRAMLGSWPQRVAGVTRSLNRPGPFELHLSGYHLSALAICFGYLLWLSALADDESG